MLCEFCPLKIMRLGFISQVKSVVLAPRVFEGINLIFSHALATSL